MGWIRRSFLKVGEVLTSHLGLPVLNATGATLTAGTLVYISGYDLTLRAFKISKADADVAGARATWVLGQDVTNGSRTVVLRSYELQGQNTSGASAVGDLVYASTTAGGWTLTNPQLTNALARRQVVGMVAVKHASAGVIVFDLDAFNDVSPAGQDLGPVPTSNIALPIVNKTGGTLTAGTLVLVGGYDATTGRLSVIKADADATGNKLASWVLRADVADSGTAYAYKTHTISLDTSAYAGSVGAPIYLDVTAGGYTETAPTGSAASQQVVGQLLVKAVAGSIGIDLLANGQTSALSRTGMQASTVTSGQVSFFFSTEQTANGAAQNVAHGLGRVPGIVLILPSATLAGATTFVKGTVDGTNVQVTGTNTAKYFVFAM